MITFVSCKDRNNAQSELVMEVTGKKRCQMSKKRNEYIDQLLSELELLEQRLLSVKESDTLPFSFFSASFDRIEKISRALHELELMQIGEMKEQMERLVRFLSESDGRGSAVGEPEFSSPEEIEEEVPENREELLSEQPEIIEVAIDQPPLQPAYLEQQESDVEQSQPEYADEPENSEQPNWADQSRDSLQPKHSESPDYPSQGTDEVIIERESVSFTERIILPEYRDPRISEVIPPSTRAGKILSEKNGQEKLVARSLNDIIQAPPAFLDLKRGISLNDRFLFQRELFNNNRSEMNRVMEALNTLDSFEEAENYLKNEQNWNFENQTVKEFLFIIKKGFE